MTPILFAKPASQELEAAIRWYEERREGLGAELYDANRQLLLQRFPYKIVYRVRAHDLAVVAIAHTSRRPEYWKDRQ